ncbi:MAG: hypothetical protein BWK76_11975 [Desulfobulbaceae bacterium A2]|nr:MAG: hypothetical protein BWK76_11975 [Desulfobulbaceae bacterium A2]
MSITGIATLVLICGVLLFSVVTPAQAEDTVAEHEISLTFDLLQHRVLGSSGITLAGFWHPLPDRDMRYRLSALLPQGYSAVPEADALVLQAEGNGQRHRTVLRLPFLQKTAESTL